MKPDEFDNQEPIENLEDEMEIINDQDLTEHEDPNMAEERLGGMGTDPDFGMGSPDFALGEIDLVDQIRRTEKTMDKATHKDKGTTG